jgi:hypothetical protein
MESIERLSKGIKSEPKKQVDRSIADMSTKITMMSSLLAEISTAFEQMNEGAVNRIDEPSDVDTDTSSQHVEKD